MRMLRLGIGLSLALLIAAPLLGQEMRDEDEMRLPRREEPLPSAGFWPTPRMMELAIDRIVEEQLGQRLDLDEDQVYRAQALFRERMVPWLNENRAEIMPVMNEYVEALLEKRAPDVDMAAEWAGRARPLMQGFHTVLRESVNEMAPMLTEEQWVSLEAQLAATDVTFEFIDRRLHHWEQGGFDPSADFHRSPEFREHEQARLAELHTAREEARDSVLQASAATGGVGPPAAGLATADRPVHTATAPAPNADEWARYVQAFIQRYRLTFEQEAKANSLLAQAQQQRDRYLRRHGEKLDEAKAVLSSAADTDRKSQAQRIVDGGQKTVERYFEQLKDRLNKLPTRAQRIAAAQAAPAEAAKR